MLRFRECVQPCVLRILSVPSLLGDVESLRSVSYSMENADHENMLMEVKSHTHTLMLTHMHTRPHAHTHTLMLTCSHPHTPMLTHMHTRPVVVTVESALSTKEEGL